MFDALKRLFSDLKARAPEPTFALDDPRLAVAALMCHVIAVDGVVRPAERTAMIATLADRYGLTTAEAGQLAEAAREAELETAALKRFTAGLARSLPIDERRDIVAALWRLIFADGAVHEFEDNVVWRIADMLGVSAAERTAIRKRIEADLEESAMRTAATVEAR